MNDPEKGALPADHTAETDSTWAAKEAEDNPEHEAAAAKLWAVYVSEAEKYDRGLVESWKSDMEGMLIFAGLFSASLTAFLIESYKTLNPDSGDTTALLLAQISQQLAASANGTPFQIPPAVPFTPPTSSLVCNTLWFISLGLSLTCALIATLLEQWARDFLHRADIRSAPVVRARVFSFLYYGLKRFKMHTVVEIIPLLLHISLVLFFVGLVAFLVPVNVALTAVVGVILATVTIIYGILTLLPLVHLDCPYRTPLSGGLWSLRQGMKTVLHWWHPPHLAPLSRRKDETIVQRIFRKAIEPSPQRSRRDTQALVWTVTSLADDNELEPFLEAIPDVLWLPEPEPASMLLGYELQQRRRYVYDEHIRHLMDDPDVQLVQRMEAFYNSCSNGPVSQQVRERRQICVYKALWAIGCLGKPVLPILGSQWLDFPRITPGVHHYATSALAIQTWAAMRAARPLLDDFLRRLADFKIELSHDDSKIPTIRDVLAGYISKLNEYSITTYLPTIDPTILIPRTADGLLSDIEALIIQLEALPFTTFMGYLVHDTTPYRFATTRSVICPKTDIPSSMHLREMVKFNLHLMMEHNRDFFQRNNDDRGPLLEGWLEDEVFRTILSYWVPEASEPLPWEVVDYINCRKSEKALSWLASGLTESAWQAVPRSIGSESYIPLPVWGADTPDYLTGALTAIWRLVGSEDTSDHPYPVPHQRNPSVFEELLDSISRTNAPSLVPSVRAIIKFGALVSAARSPRLGSMHPQDVISGFEHHFPAQTFIPTPAEDVKDETFGQLMSLWNSKAVLHVLTEFIECCVSGDLPYKAAETVARIAWPIQSSIHSSHQLRFSNAVQELLSVAVHSAEREALSQQILNLPGIFTVYTSKKEHSSNYAWLDDSDARTALKESLSTYVAQISSNDKEHKLCSRLQEIVANLDIMHPPQAIDGVPSPENPRVEPE
ncbi:hypothetical protein C8R47DRAFT_402692 [Mycena vitilis]|nr:hypothetical protein C8R47DRAFT_402692 [Mycena vitilis]